MVELLPANLKAWQLYHYWLTIGETAWRYLEWWQCSPEEQQSIVDKVIYLAQEEPQYRHPEKRDEAKPHSMALRKPRQARRR